MLKTEDTTLPMDWMDRRTAERLMYAVHARPRQDSRASVSGALAWVSEP